MRRLGLVPGARVGVIALNSDRYLELYLGLPAAGYVLVPVNSRLAPAEMRATVWAGGTHVIMPRFDPGLAIDLIEREALTHTPPSPACWRWRPTRSSPGRGTSARCGT